VQTEVGQVYAALGDREKAMGLLRAMMAGPCPEMPREFRYDPLWSRVKDDPRFDEILNSAKPL
jgi:hypothetical protein